MKSRIVVKDCCSQVRISKSNNKIQLVVRAVDNETDPLSIIKVFRFESKKKERRAEIASTSTFGGHSANNYSLINFTAKKYGEKSYLITLSDMEAGEFGLIVQNPNALDERSTIASCFGVDAE